YADIPYKIDDGKLDVWVRLACDSAENRSTPAALADGAAREKGLTRAVADHTAVQIQLQRVGGAQQPFLPVAEIRFEEEIQIDQEELHFDPVAGRGFVPHGLLTGVRRIVYPASTQSRPPGETERARREHESIFRRLRRFLNERPSTPLEGWS